MAKGLGIRARKETVARDENGTPTASRRAEYIGMKSVAAHDDPILLLRQGARSSHKHPEMASHRSSPPRAVDLPEDDQIALAPKKNRSHGAQLCLGWQSPQFVGLKAKTLPGLLDVPLSNHRSKGTRTLRHDDNRRGRRRVSGTERGCRAGHRQERRCTPSTGFLGATTQRRGWSRSHLTRHQFRAVGIFRLFGMVVAGSIGNSTAIGPQLV